MQDLDALIAQAADARQQVRDAQAVENAASHVLQEALKREGLANRAVYNEVDRRVTGGPEVAG